MTVFPVKMVVRIDLLLIKRFQQKRNKTDVKCNTDSSKVQEKRKSVRIIGDSKKSVVKLITYSYLGKECPSQELLEEGMSSTNTSTPLTI